MITLIDQQNICRAFEPSVEGQWYQHWTYQVKDGKIVTCCYPG